jgi:hypothetical protein
MDFTKTIKTLKLLLVAVLVGGASLTANAETTFTDSASGLKFEINSDGTTCSVVKPTSGKYSGDIVIPSTVTYNSTIYDVTSISGTAFRECTSLTAVSFPEGIKDFGDYAFYNCVSLTSIELPNSLTTMGIGVFQNCTSLKYLQFGSGLTVIPQEAFKDCTSLIGVTTTQFIGEEQNVLIIPNNISSINGFAFFNCTSLEHVWIGDGCTYVGTLAFKGDTGLKTISSMNKTAPSLTYKDTFSDETYKNATLYIQAGEDVWDSYTKSNHNGTIHYWYLFLNRDNSTYGTDDGGIQVGVGEVANDDIAVTTDGMAIEITGYEGEVNVYNVAGMRVYQGSDSRIELPNSGIYIVIVNGKSYKVGIK